MYLADIFALTLMVIELSQLIVVITVAIQNRKVLNHPSFVA